MLIGFEPWPIQIRGTIECRNRHFKDSIVSFLPFCRREFDFHTRTALASQEETSIPGLSHMTPTGGRRLGDYDRVISWGQIHPACTEYNTCSVTASKGDPSTYQEILELFPLVKKGLEQSLERT